MVYSKALYLWMETVNITFLWTLGAVIQKLTEQVGKSLSNHGNKNKPAGGVNVAQAFIKKEEVQELKVSLLIAIVISLSNWTRYVSFFFFHAETILMHWRTQRRFWSYSLVVFLGTSALVYGKALASEWAVASDLFIHTSYQLTPWLFWVTTGSPKFGNNWYHFYLRF